MIPQFPKFKKLQLTDRDRIGELTEGYIPSSDFQFSNLWSWDIHGKARLSRLYGNLVVQFVEQETGEAFFSFLGCTAVDRTAEALIQLSHARGMSAVLKRVPECSARELNRDVFSVMPSDEHHDYILMTDEVATYDGAKYASKRNDARKFLQRYPEAHFSIIDLKCLLILQQVRQLFQKWINQRQGFMGGQDANREACALERYLACKIDTNHLNAGVFHQGSLIAFSLSEIVSDEYALTAFEKADTSQYAGIGAYLNQQIAKILSNRGIRYINIEEDLGIPGLRKSKQSYASHRLLRKFAVALRVPESLYQSPLIPALCA